MSEQRLIDANALIESAKEITGNNDQDFRHCFPYWQFAKAIETAPTVPAVVFPNTKRSEVNAEGWQKVVLTNEGAKPYNVDAGFEVLPQEAVSSPGPLWDAGYFEGYEQGKRDAVVHGCWIDKSESGKRQDWPPECSACHKRSNAGYSDFCHNCGAQMGAQEGATE